MRSRFSDVEVPTSSHPDHPDPNPVLSLLQIPVRSNSFQVALPHAAGVANNNKKWEGGGVGNSPPPLRAPISVTAGRAAHLPIIYPQRSCQHNCVMITCRATQPTDLPHNPCDCATNRECRSPAFVGSCLNSTCICMTALYLPMPMSVLPVCQGTPAREQ